MTLSFFSRRPQAALTEASPASDQRAAGVGAPAVAAVKAAKWWHTVDRINERSNSDCQVTNADELASTIRRWRCGMTVEAECYWRSLSLVAVETFATVRVWSGLGPDIHTDVDELTTEIIDTAKEHRFAKYVLLCRFRSDDARVAAQRAMVLDVSDR